MMKTLRTLGTTLFCFLILAGGLSAQATLSFQGILKKSNGVAVDDGEYSIRFSLYNTETGGTAIWTETQSNVEVSSGVYSVLLGSANPITASFNEEYYLGVKIGGTPELTPRLRLTSAPYALSLIGQSNLFPSTGTVKSDELVNAGKMVIGGSAVSPTHTLLVTGGILARNGAPGAGGGLNNGYAFDNNPGSGLFSTADNKVSLFAQNKEVLSATPDNLEVNGPQSVSGDLSLGSPGAPANINLSKGGAVVYNGNRDWQLVYVDDFEGSSTDGWEALSIGTITHATIGKLPSNNQLNNDLVKGDLIWVTTNGHMRKEYDLTGIPHKHIKVEFTAVAFGSDDWDYLEDIMTAGFFSGNDLIIAWRATAVGQITIIKGEMTQLNYPGNTIGVFFNSAVTHLWEVMAVGNIEVYVR